MGVGASGVGSGGLEGGGGGGGWQFSLVVTDRFWVVCLIRMECKNRFCKNALLCGDSCNFMF